jgi:quinol monooxygenase YgiN
MSEPRVVVATLIAKPGKEDIVETALRQAAAKVHTEPGCLLYALHRKAGAGGHFVMIEKWASAEALGVHNKAAALRELGPVLADALQGPAEITVLDPLPAGDAGLGAL